MAYNIPQYDYSATLEIECESAANILSSAFYEEFGLNTNLVSRYGSNYQSECPTKSFYKHFVKAIPSKLKWSVRQDEASKSSVCISIQTPIYLRIINSVLIVIFLIAIKFSFDETKYIFSGYYSFKERLFYFGIFFGAVSALWMILMRGITLRTSRYYTLFSVLKEAFKNHDITVNEYIHKTAFLKQFMFYILLIILTFMCVTVIRINNFVGLSELNKPIIILFCLVAPVFFHALLLTCYKWQSIHYKINRNIISGYVALILFPYILATPILMEEYPSCISKADKNVFARVNITQIFENNLPAKKEYRANEQMIVENAIGKLQTLGLNFLGVTICLLIVMPLTLLLFLNVRMADYTNKEDASIQYYVFGKMFTEECEFNNYRTLQLPFSWKFVVILDYFVWGGALWGMCIYVFAHLIPLLNNGVTPMYGGERFIVGTVLLGLSLFGNISKIMFYVLVYFILMIPIIPMFIFIYLHIRSFVVSMRRIKSYAPIEKNNNICRRVDEIACSIGIKGITCVKDSDGEYVTPLAVIHGIVPKKYILLTDNGIEFLNKYPEHSVAILAHEVYHFVDGCKQLWWYALLSRIALVGAGFLSILHDMVDMDDKADKFAQKYLREHKMDESLLDSAIILMGKGQGDIEKNTKLKTLMGFGLVSQPKGKNDNIPFYKGSVKDNIKNFFLTFYTLYFDTELYAYLHRSWLHRCQR